MIFNSDILKNLRKQKKLSQYELALETSVERDIILRLERGERKRPSFETVEKLAEYFEVPMDIFISNQYVSDAELIERCRSMGIDDVLIIELLSRFERQLQHVSNR